MVMQLEKTVTIDAMLADMSVYGANNAEPLGMDNFDKLEAFTVAIWACAVCGAQLTDPAHVLCNTCFFA